MEHQPTSDHILIDIVEKKEDPGQVELKEKHTLQEELQRTHNNPSSSSDEEVDGGGEGKKGLKDKISRNDTNGSDKKLDDQEAPNSGEKKGFLDKIIEKLPGQHHKKTEEGIAKDPHESPSSGDEMKEKKGIFNKIKEKLPGHHKNDEEAKKDK